MRSLPSLLVTSLLAACAAPVGDSEVAGDGHSPAASFSPARKADGDQPIVLASAETTTALLAGPRGRRLSDPETAALFADAVRPPLVHDDAPLAPWTYLRTMSALGYYGPLGPYGPLGELGPLGDSANGVAATDFAGPWLRALH